MPGDCLVVNPEVQVSFQNRVDSYFDNLIFQPSTFYRIKESWQDMLERKKANASAQERIAAINEELRSHRQELKSNFSVQLLKETRTLVAELHSIISFYFTRQKRYVKHILINYFGGAIQDIRRKYRQIIQNIFKNLPDFSGCEEEAEFDSTANFKPFFSLLNRQNLCIRQNFYWTH
jgi:hypothetical protein